MTEETQTAEQSDFPEAWKPDAGTTITGAVVEVKMIDPSGQGPYPCVTLQSADGQQRAIHAFHSVLRRELARNAPKVGDEITITYHGERAGGAYGKYHSYQVRGGQGREFNWDAELPPEERQAQATADVPIAPAPIPAQPAMSPEQVAQLRELQKLQAQQETATAAAQTFGEAPPFLWEPASWSELKELEQN